MSMSEETTKAGEQKITEATQENLHDHGISEGAGKAGDMTGETSGVGQSGEGNEGEIVAGDDSGDSVDSTRVTNSNHTTDPSHATDPSHTTDPSDQEEPVSEEELLARRIQALEAEVKQLQDQQLRRVAEMENMKKRMQRDRIQLFEQAQIGAVETFLPVFDDLMRTLQAMETSDTESPYFEGVQMVVNKFNDALTDKGLTRIDETGVSFNVNEHDALMRQKAADDSVESDTVLQVLESGYKLGDRTIRHAKVIVSE